jgi:hypothetical protein
VNGNGFRGIGRVCGGRWNGVAVRGNGFGAKGNRFAGQRNVLGGCGNGFREHGNAVGLQRRVIREIWNTVGIGENGDLRNSANVCRENRFQPRRARSTRRTAEMIFDSTLSELGRICGVPRVGPLSRTNRWGKRSNAFGVSRGQTRFSGLPFRIWKPHPRCRRRPIRSLEGPLV